MAPAELLEKMLATESELRTTQQALRTTQQALAASEAKEEKENRLKKAATPLCGLDQQGGGRVPHAQQHDDGEHADGWP